MGRSPRLAGVRGSREGSTEGPRVQGWRQSWKGTPLFADKPEGEGFLFPLPTTPAPLSP